MQAGAEAPAVAVIGAALDWGNVETAVAEATAVGDERARFLPQIKATCERIARLVGHALDESYFPLVLGGDHSIALGTLGGLARSHGLGGVLWFDAHADLNTPETTPSGNVHGMVLAASMGLAGERFESEVWPLPAVDPDRVALVGVRTLDLGERALIRRCGLQVYTMSDIDRIGVERAIRQALAHIAGPGFVHVSLDLDSIDPMSRRVSARRCGAASRTARRTSRSNLVGARRLARDRRGEPDPRPRERDREAGRRARRERPRRDDPLTRGKPCFPRVPPSLQFLRDGRVWLRASESRFATRPLLRACTGLPFALRGLAMSIR